MLDGATRLIHPLSVNWRVSELFATTCQNLIETRRNSRSQTRLKPDWFLDSEKSVMKTRFILFKRAGVYYSEDTVTRKQHCLRTKDEAEALALLHSKNEAHRQPVTDTLRRRGVEVVEATAWQALWGSVGLVRDPPSPGLRRD
jgi:hypothetical protein